MKYTTKQGDYIDQICWEKFGRVNGVLEKVLDMNPGLSSLPLSLPLGKEIELPGETPEQEINEIVRLFS